MANYLKHKAQSIIANLKTVHERLKQVDVNRLRDDLPMNPYQALGQWALDYIVVLGSLWTVSAMVVFRFRFGWWTPLMPIGFGVMVYVTEETIQRFASAIKR